jgi:hypothetical protein
MTPILGTAPATSRVLAAEPVKTMAVYTPISPAESPKSAAAREAMIGRARCPTAPIACANVMMTIATM